MKEANASPVSLASRKAGEGPEALCHSVGNRRGVVGAVGCGVWEGLVGSECDCLTHSVSQFPERASPRYRDVSKGMY